MINDDVYEETVVRYNRAIYVSPFAEYGAGEDPEEKKTKGDRFCFRVLKYHSSYDWLMDVVDNIQITTGLRLRLLPQERKGFVAEFVHPASTLMVHLSASSPSDNVQVAIYELVAKYCEQYNEDPTTKKTWG